MLHPLTYLSTMDTFINVLEAGAAIAAAWFGARALVISKQANELAQKSQDDALAFQSEERAREEQARRNAMAMSVYAYWAKRQDGKWGVVVTNEGPTATIIRNFHIEVTCKKGPEARAECQEFAVLPTGTFFIEHVWTDFGWGNLTAPGEDQWFEPAVFAKRWSVDRLCFTDHFGDTWTFTPEGGYDRTTGEISPCTRCATGAEHPSA